MAKAQNIIPDEGINMFFDVGERGNPTTDSGNPYQEALESGEYTKGQNIIDWIFGTQRKKYNSAAADFDAELAKMRYQAELNEEFNSPERQAQLMREAGLNPDLSSLDFKHNSASMASGNLSSGIAGISNNDAVSALTGILSIVSSGAAKVLSAVSSYQSIQGQKLDNQGKAILNKSYATSYGNEMLNNALQYGVSLYGQSLYDDFQRELTWKPTSEDEIFPAVTYDFNFKDLPLEENVKSDYKKIFEELVNSRSPLLLGAIYEKFGNVEQLKSDYNKLVGRATNVGTDTDEQKMYRAISDLQYSSMEIALKYEKRLKSLLSADAAAAAENSSNLLQSISSDYEADVINSYPEGTAEVEGEVYGKSREIEQLIADFTDEIGNLYYERMLKYKDTFGDSWYSSVLLDYANQVRTSLLDLFKVAIPLLK